MKNNSSRLFLNKRHVLLVFMIEFLIVTITIPTFNQLNIKIDINDGDYSLVTYNKNPNIRFLSSSFKYLKRKLMINYYYKNFGKVLYLKSLESFKEAVKKYHNVNKNWIILIDNPDNYYQIEDFINNPTKYKNHIFDCKNMCIPYFINAVLFSSEIDESLLTKAKSSIPLLVAHSFIFSNIKENYSIENESSNYIFNIKITKSYSSQMYSVNLYSSLGLIGITACFIILIFLLIKKFSILNTDLYKFLYFINLLIIYNLSFYIYIISQYKETDDSVAKYYCVLFLNATTCIFKALVWGLFILLAYGWKTFFITLPRSDLRWMIFIFIFIMFEYISNFVCLILKINFMIQAFIFSVICLIYIVFCTIRNILRIRVRLYAFTIYLIFLYRRE